MEIEDESSNDSETCNAGDFQAVFEYATLGLQNQIMM